MPLWTILTKCPAPLPPTWAKPFSGARCLENRFQLLDNRFFATDHQTVTFLQTPDAAAGAGVDEVNAKLFQFFGAPDGIFVM